MPKNRKPARRIAETLRVASPLDTPAREHLTRVGSLEIVQGAEVDLGRQVLCDHPIVIGRDERVDLSLNDGSISRAHCSVERDPNTSEYVLVDLGSTNGTSVNGARVQDRVALSPGDKIFLGASVLRFALSDAVDLEYHSRLEELVSTDPLTGLDSKRAYDALFEVLSERAAAEESPLTVMMMDMDGLKEINDTHGHHMGSFAIAEAARLARSVMSEQGNVARFGGDEFVGCFPGLDREQARQLAEQLRELVRGHDFVLEGVRVRPTISIGIASFPEDVRAPADLFRAADQALYRAKRAGKDRVEVG